MARRAGESEQGQTFKLKASVIEKGSEEHVFVVGAFEIVAFAGYGQ